VSSIEVKFENALDMPSYRATDDAVCIRLAMRTVLHRASGLDRAEPPTRA
jgi:hypothetical protein